ncbi:hypothetical protein SAMN03080617_03370 [Algoriphagus alkaliphilus]|uniref:Uncharacterized protein n=1 Tax=Algoriphagus alkaliphilus TaxID=279824 RepID=A0A1G5Z836_9BACT|nr:hypothetical protein SAMN03080617_03370 [Algoriphagus alkaliphilus]
MPNEIYTFNYQKENLKSFLDVYELQRIVIPPAFPVKGLK